MSKTIKTIASIALPIIGTLVAPGIGTALGSSLASGTLGAIGGALGGALGGGLNGGIAGAALGGLTGYAGAGAIQGIAGQAAGSTLAQTTGNALLQGPTYGTGISGALTGGGAQALGQGVSGAFSSPVLSGITSIGNQLLTQNSADTAEEAARIQAGAIDRGIAEQRPYTQAGVDALGQINKINADPAGYIKNNPLYTSLAADAQQRLLASEAAKGKVGSGGTAAALQDRLLQVGNGLVQQQVGNLQNVANTGQVAATNVTSQLGQQGDVNAAGKVGAASAYNTGYQNQLNTLLALQQLGRTPTYSPTQIQFR